MKSVANDPCCGRLGEREGAWRIATGWIGTGQMGAALVTRLLKAAYDVAVYRRARSKAVALAALEAPVVDSPTGLADRDVVFAMVSGPADLLDVTCGEGGVLTAGAAPGVLVGSSTVSAEVPAMAPAAALAAAGTAFLAVPVSGNPKVAHSGRLTLAVPGPEGITPLLITNGYAALPSTTP